MSSSSKEPKIEFVKTVYGDDTERGCKTQVKEPVSFSLKLKQDASIPLADKFRDLGYVVPPPIMFNLASCKHFIVTVLLLGHGLEFM